MTHPSRRVVAAALAAAALALAPGPLAAQACGTEVEHAKLDVGPFNSPVHAPPRLVAPDGAAVVGGPFSVAIENAEPLTVGALVYSAIEAPQFDLSYAAVFHFAPPFGTIFFATDAGGSSPLLSAADPVDPSFCGGFAIFQAGVFDATAVGGVAVTNAVRLRVGSVTRPLLVPEVEPTATSSLDLGEGDVDGDGLDDLLRANGVVEVRLALAAGGFDAPLSFLVGPGTHLVPELGDLDGNGTNDLVVVDTTGASVTTARLDASLSVLGTDTYSVGDVAKDVALLDLDTDGDLDLVVARDTFTGLAVLEGDGLGGFTAGLALGVGAPQIQVEAADVDLDGTQDLVASTTATVVALGDGAGGFAVAAPFGPAGLLALDVLDANGDGLPDVVGYSGNTIVVQPGNGDGTLGALYGYSDGLTLRDLRFADLDGDGLPEALDFVRTFADGLLLVHRGLPGGGLGPPVGRGAISAPTALAVVDADRDGHLDAVVAGGSPGAWGTVTLRGVGDGTLRAPLAVPTGIGSDQVATADLDGNGYDDAVVAGVGSAAESIVVVLNGPEGPTAGAAIASLVNPVGLSLADVDGDGHLDVVVVQESGSLIHVHPGDGAGGFGAALSSTGIFGATDAALGDFDEDGDLDLYVSGLQPRLFPGNGDGTFGSPRVVPGDDEAAVGDVDGDGHLDVVVAHLSTVLVYFGAGDGTLPTFAEVADVAATPHVPGLVHLDGDGHLDLVVMEGTQAFQPTRVTVRINAGDGSFEPVQSVDVGDTVRGWDAADFDGDGQLDVAVSEDELSFGGAYLRLLKGDGAGGLTTLLRVPAGDITRAIAVADVDGDDLPDLVRTGATPNVWLHVNQLGE